MHVRIVDPIFWVKFRSFNPNKMLSIRPYTRMMLRMIAITIPFLVASCSPNDPEVETPLVTFEQSTETSFAGDVNLTFKATDNNMITRIRVFLDDVLIGEKAFDQKETEFTFTWDSKSATEGDHVLRVIVSDDEGHDTEETFEIEVDNYFVTVSVPPNYHLNRDLIDAWVYLSDQQGALLGVKEMADDTVMYFEHPDNFEGGPVQVHLFTHSEDFMDVKRYRIDTYTHVEPGDFVLPNYIPAPVEDYGKATVAVTGRSTGDLLDGIASPDIANTIVADSQEKWKIDFDLTATSADVFVMMKQGDNAKVHMFEALSAGETLSADISTFVNTEKTTVNCPFENPDYANSYQVGYRPGEPIAEGSVFNQHYVPMGTSYDVHYPTTNGIFSSYINLGGFIKGNRNYYYLTYGAEPTPAFKMSPTEVTSSDFTANRIKVNLSNVGDHAQLFSMYHIGTSNIYSWIFTPQANAIDIKLPDVPAEIKTALSFSGDASRNDQGVTLVKGTGTGYYNYYDLVNSAFHGFHKAEDGTREEMFLTIYLTQDVGGRVNVRRQQNRSEEIFLRMVQPQAQ